MISISLDIDWAPDEVLEYSLSLLDEFNIEATLFMTHKTNLYVRDHEIAIHPNFTSLDYQKHIEERLNDFPNARGVRAHSLFYTERLRAFYEKYKMSYSSNAMIYRQPHISPYLISPLVVELPIYFMDTFYIIMEKQMPDFDLNKLHMRESGMKVFDFHPVHIFLNTDNLSRYEDAKKHYMDPKELIKHRNISKRGVKDIFVDLLRFIKEENHKSRKMIDIATQYSQ